MFANDDKIHQGIRHIGPIRESVATVPIREIRIDNDTKTLVFNDGFHTNKISLSTKIHDKHFIRN